MILKIKESELAELVRESVKKYMNESGHEWWNEEDWNPNYPEDEDEISDNDKVDMEYFYNH